MAETSTSAADIQSGARDIAGRIREQKQRRAGNFNRGACTLHRDIFRKGLCTIRCASFGVDFSFDQAGADRIDADAFGGELIAALEAA
jgi:hypothetical protein